MSLLRTQQRGVAEDTLAKIATGRLGRGGAGPVSGEQAMRLSVAWACRRLRADLVSTMPIDVFRESSIGSPVSMPKPPVMLAPGGDRCLWIEWLYSSQMDLDGYGNCFGVVEARDSSAQQRPQVIRLVPASTAAVRLDKKTGRLVYRFGHEPYDQADVWHEKQFTVAGSPVGLSPIAYAALSMNASLSAAEFAAAWFGNGATPAAHLKNTARKLDKIESRKAKERFKASVTDGDVFVSGNDWEYSVIAGKASESMFLDQINATNGDICRFLGVPGDVVDVANSGSSITYANITQRNLQLLIMHLNPALIRRESAFTYALLPAPRYAKFNRGSLLQMDPATRASTIKTRVDSRTLTVDEARELEDLPPLTADQVDQFQTLFGRTATGQTPPNAALPGGTS